METKILYLPLDERPCNYDFAKRIADCSGKIELLRPDLSAMGRKKIPADFKKIREFLVGRAREAQVCILSLDALLYGGIVPSRLHSINLEELRARLRVVDEIKAANPSIKIYAFALIMRCPSYSSADEEPDYYETCGREIFLTGQAKHKRELGLLGEEDAEKLLNEYSEKTGEYLADFENRRKINLSMLVEILKKAGDKIDFIVIPQDDSSPYGYTARDREALFEIIKANNLQQVAAYPGADEVGMTLLSRAITEIEGKKPKIKCVYATEEARSLIPLYEDRELEKTLLSQIDTAGCELSGGEADITLYLNYPAYSPQEVNGNTDDGYKKRNMPLFIQKIANGIKECGVVAVADGAFCNGGDVEFIEALSQKADLFGLSSYAGWNTSSNTIGTAICQAVSVFFYGKNEAQNKFLAERFYEDIGYCAHTRAFMCTEVLPALGLGYFDAGDSCGKVAALVKEETNAFIKKLLPKVASRYVIDKCFMPWARMFEVGLTVKKRDDA